MKALIAVGLCALTGCVALPPVQVIAQRPTVYHDVAYYDANPLERSQANAWCGNNPGLATKIPACDSADTSGIHAWHAQMGWK
jgi:hypothetical protein